MPNVVPEQLQPLGDRLLLRPIGFGATVETTAGGIVIPLASRDVHQRHMQFEILAVGDLVSDPTLLPGLRVVARPLRGVQVNLEHESLFVCLEEDVEAVLDL